jgi:hypothetical protein
MSENQAGYEPDELPVVTEAMIVAAAETFFAPRSL